MTTMGEESNKLSKLFCPVRNKPLQFAIILDKLLQVECLRVLKYIENGGGTFHGFDPTDSKFIVLASSKYKPPPDQTVFDIKYVKRCVNEKKLLDLRDFQISGEKISGPGCFSFQHLVEADRCTHCLTAEQVLSRMKSLRGFKRKTELSKIEQIMKDTRLKMEADRTKAFLESCHLDIRAEVERQMEERR